ncbi:low molecular weight protein-tyrosine-phosphatase [Gynuella sunshinyii]|uniref:protein-tyrosine-phosphatase n=1 Tax=Gynuella sunshinyii YC6258 TaxID=1445510 RepID=A0A0C5VNF0_9GAMM|nr:low molecular weight protein-tyrosine-phosphatase [Gynuella sunshinyii]AJQ95831.1 protein-tyrosine-phosphatase [Gynuella sunshinyii YC6258]
MVTRVLFICLGNICRSPIAEGVFRALIQERGIDDQFVVDSAGTAGYHVGEGPDERAVRALKGRKVDISDLRARQLQSSDFDEFDYILVADRQNLKDVQTLAGDNCHAEVRLFLSYDPESKVDEIPDPYYGGSEGFETVIDLCKAASEKFLQHIQNPAK